MLITTTREINYVSSDLFFKRKQKKMTWEVNNQDDRKCKEHRKFIEIVNDYLRKCFDAY